MPQSELDRLNARPTVDLLSSKSPTALEATHFTEASRSDESATVTVDVAAEMQIQDRGLFATTTAYKWTFEARHVTGVGGSGWKVSAFESPEICGVYVDCEP